MIDTSEGQITTYYVCPVAGKLIELRPYNGSHNVMNYHEYY